MIKALIALARPKHWVKNVFVLMPAPFALAAGATVVPLSFVAGLCAMCLAASGIYVINDLLDAKRDRLHPAKRLRPIAAGTVSKGAAGLWSLSLIAAAGGLAWSTHIPQAMLVVGLYVVLNLVYSLGGKNVALIDVFLLSSGFVLRVLLGCALLEVPASNWLLLCSSALALFLALAKRRADLAKGFDANHRPSLAGYNTEFLDQAMGIMAGMSIVGYSLYCMEADVLQSGREFWSLPFVVFGVLDYLRFAQVDQEGGSPVDLLLSSPRILICGLGWTGAILFSVGLW